MTPAWAALFVSGVVLFSGLAACRENRSGDGAPSSSSVPAEPPPLDTNWRRDPGHVLAVHDRAPDFEGIAHTGMRVRLSSFAGKPVVIYFASRAGSAEGAVEARAFRDQWMRFNERVATVLGVSTDDRATEYDFASAERLPFLLVADEESHIARAFGALEQGHVANMAFIVGADGTIAHVFSDAPPEGHADAVIRALE